MIRLLFFMFLVGLLAVGALTTPGLEDFGKGLILFDLALTVVLAFMWFLRDSGEAEETRREPPRRDYGPDPVYYPDPPEETPNLRGPGPERWAPRGEFAEAQPHRALPPMRREPVEQPIEVPNWPIKVK